MIRTVFVDYTGTLIADYDRNSMEMARRCAAHSRISDVNEIVSYWWKLIKKSEKEYFKDQFISEDEIVTRGLEICREELGLEENMEQLHTLMQKFWVEAPVFDDAADFVNHCPVPVYIVTNISEKYVAEGLRRNGIHASGGIVCADMARAYKPHRELFEKALEVSGCSADEVVHVGDSAASDVKGAQAAGIRPILVDRRGGVQCEGVTVVNSLKEASRLLGNIMDQRWF